MANVLKPFVAAGEDNQIIGYTMWCPGCEMLHSVYTVPYKNRPHWTFNGNLEKPTFVPSLRVRYPGGAPVERQCLCHSFIRDGQWQFLNDCTHSLAGKTVPMVPVPD